MPYYVGNVSKKIKTTKENLIKLKLCRLQPLLQVLILVDLIPKMTVMEVLHEHHIKEGHVEEITATQAMKDEGLEVGVVVRIVQVKTPKIKNNLIITL